MFSLFFIVVLIPLIILSFWFPDITSLIILILYLIIEVMGIVPTMFKVQPSKELNFNTEEAKIFSKYYVFFRYTLGAQDISKIFSIIQISTLILAPLFWYKGLILQASILVINYFIAAYFAEKLNPIHYLSGYIKKGKLRYVHEYEVLKSISGKITNFEDAEFKKKYPDTAI